MDNIQLKGIKFSEETKEFSTGAHRGGGDKAPMEYLPMTEAIEVLICSNNLPSYTKEEAYAKIASNIDEFKITGDLTLVKEAGAIFGKLYFHNVYACLEQTALHFKQGADKYGFNNWQRGMPLLDYAGSLSRHFIKVIEGWDDEPHHTAFMWNVLAIMWTVKHIPQMNNLPLRGAEIVE